MPNAVRTLSDGLPPNLLRYGSVGDFRAANPLPRDTQIEFDRAVLEVRQQKLALVADLLSLGLTYPLPNWLGVPYLYWEATNPVGNARRVMEPKSRGERAIPNRAPFQLPIYATVEDWSIGIRQQLAYQRAGISFDTTMASQATRNVNEQIEDQALYGAGLAVGGYDAPGFLSDPANYSQYSSSGEAWTASGHSGEDILTDILAMIEVLTLLNFDGPYRLYVSTAYALKLGQDYKSATSGTIAQRIADLGNVTVVTVPKLPTDYTILLQPTNDVVDLVVGQTPALMSWEDLSGLERYFMLMACMILRLKQDYNGTQGYVVGGTAASFTAP